MKITQLTIDDNELKEAVRAYLKTKGIDLPIHSVSKDYSWKTESEVVFEFEVESAPPGAVPEMETVTAKPTSVVLAKDSDNF